jgi:hypothetical protein
MSIGSFICGCIPEWSVPRSDAAPRGAWPSGGVDGRLKELHWTPVSGSGRRRGFRARPRGRPMGQMPRCRSVRGSVGANPGSSWEPGPGVRGVPSASGFLTIRPERPRNRSCTDRARNPIRRAVLVVGRPGMNPFGSEFLCRQNCAARAPSGPGPLARNRQPVAYCRNGSQRN